MLPGCSNAHSLALEDDDDDNAQDHYAPDKFDIITATHSSPISAVRTPPDFSATAAYVQHQHPGFDKQPYTTSGTACFDLDSALDAATVAGGLGAYHPGVTEFEMVCDPFGLDASLFSI
jgi:hypothetical protein